MRKFSRPEKSGLNPAPSSSRAEIRPLWGIRPLVGVERSGDHLEQRRLPAAVATDDRDRVTACQVERDARRRRAPRSSTCGQEPGVSASALQDPMMRPSEDAVHLRDVVDREDGASRTSDDIGETREALPYTHQPSARTAQA